MSVDRYFLAVSDDDRTTGGSCLKSPTTTRRFLGRIELHSMYGKLTMLASSIITVS